MTKELLVVSSYPSNLKQFKNRTGGVASYTKDTLKWIKRENPELNIEVIANIFDKKKEYLDENDINVKRVWKSSNALSILGIAKYIKASNAKKVVFPFEFYIVGDLMYLPFYISLLYFAKLIGKDPYIIFHNVLSDVDVFERNRIKAILFKSIRNIFYKLAITPCKKAIVFEQALKEHLNVNGKGVVIPHAVKPVKRISKQEAKRKLGLTEKKKYIL